MNNENRANPSRPKRKGNKTPNKNNQKRYRPIHLYTRNQKPAAFTSTSKVRMDQRMLSDNSVRVTGYDLIYSTGETVIEGPFCVVTCNPAYWEGTRIATLANSYSQYRPIHLRFDYYPQVSTMTSGNVVCGTLWNNVPSSEHMQQVLATSNGGKMFPVYSEESTEIRLKTNLNQNLYNFQGFLDTDTNPFLFIALTQQTNNITPGYFMVSYQYEFKNPLGEGFDYSTQVSQAGKLDTTDVWDTTTAVLLSSTTVAAIGTQLILKVVDDAIQFFLGGSRVGVVASTIIKLFKSRPRKVSKLQEELEDLTQSNVLTDMAVTLEQTIQGSAVTTVISSIEGTNVALSDFTSFDSVMGDTEYKVIGGLFAKLTQVGIGRYNIGFIALSNSTDNLRNRGLYVIRFVHDNVITNYAFCSQNTNLVVGLNESRCNAVTLHIQYGNGRPVECQIPVMDSIEDAEYSVIADVALLSTESAFGYQGYPIVGSGTTVLVPTVEWRLSNSRM